MGQSEQLKQALKRAGLSQTKYCEIRGIPLRTFQHWIHEDNKLNGWLLDLILKDIAEIGDEIRTCDDPKETL